VTGMLAEVRAVAGPILHVDRHSVGKPRRPPTECANRHDGVVTLCKYGKISDGIMG